MKRKKLINVMTVMLGASALMPNDAPAGGELRVTYGNGADSSTVRFVENSVNSGPFNNSLAGFQIFNENGANTYFRVGVGANINSLFNCPLQFNSIADGTPSSLVYQFYFLSSFGSFKANINTFSSAILITSRTVSQGYTNCTDVIKEVNNGSITNNMPASIGGANGIYRHGTNTLLFTRKDSAIPTITSIRKNGSLVDLVVTNVLAGEHLIPEYSFNLGNNWISDSHKITYVPVTSDSFGKPTSTTISNVMADYERMFYRIKVE